MASLLIDGYLPASALNNGHKSARAAGTFFRRIVKNAGGKVSKLEVLSGKIFISLKDEKGIPEVKETLKTLKNVNTSEPTDVELLYVRERARGDAEAAQKAQP